MTNRILSGAICFLLAPVMALAGCATSASPTTSRPSASAQPRIAAYRCDDESEIRIEYLGGIVRVHTPTEPPKTGESDSVTAAPVELTAAPPGQQSRYGIDGYALVLEGREALWMKAGRTPLTCMR
jgi:hypothetical protein